MAPKQISDIEESLGFAPRNLLFVGSGLLTDQERNIRNLVAAGAGAVVTKTIHPSPPFDLDERVFQIPTGMINSTTYSKHPVRRWLEILGSLADDGLPVIASIHAETPSELGDLAAAIARTGCRALELGISCINEDDALPDGPQRVEAYSLCVKAATSLPFYVKLAVGEGLDDRVRAAVKCGAAGVTLSDTLPAAAISSEGGKIELGGVYGYSGPGIKPLVLAAIWKLRRRGCHIPILAVGGISGGQDAIDYLSVGANATQVYTALHSEMIPTLKRIVAEYEVAMARIPEDESIFGRALAGTADHVS